MERRAKVAHSISTSSGMTDPVNPFNIQCCREISPSSIRIGVMQIFTDLHLCLTISPALPLSLPPCSFLVKYRLRVTVSIREGWFWSIRLVSWPPYYILCDRCIFGRWRQLLGGLASGKIQESQEEGEAKIGRGTDLKFCRACKHPLETDTDTFNNRQENSTAYRAVPRRLVSAPNSQRASCEEPRNDGVVSIVPAC